VAGIRTVIGIDCAVSETRRGLALAVRKGREWELCDIRAGRDANNSVGTVAQWIRDSRGPALLALDAPLGWPSRMGQHLPSHRAGESIEPCIDEFFCRYTDRVVRCALVDRHPGFRPLEVGANLIARTAHASLSLLKQLREDLSADIPLAWTIAPPGTSAIEVYPAATLLAHGASITKYKNFEEGKGGVEARQAILKLLGDRLSLHVHRDLLLTNGHALDAMVCVVAGIDFLSGDARAPDRSDLARKEGWIWFRNPVQPEPVCV
jgi:predicted RNase H-like nuclease